MMQLYFTCCLCPPEQQGVLTPYPSDGAPLPEPEGWMSISMRTCMRALPPKFDGIAADGPPGMGVFLEVEMQPFDTIVYLCPEHRKTASVADLDAIYMARFRERDEPPTTPAYTRPEPPGPMPEDVERYLATQPIPLRPKKPRE